MGHRPAPRRKPRQANESTFPASLIDTLRERGFGVETCAEAFPAQRVSRGMRGWRRSALTHFDAGLHSPVGQRHFVAGADYRKRAAVEREFGRLSTTGRSRRCGCAGLSASGYMPI